MKRYDIYAYSDGHYCPYWEAEEDDEGRFVKYEDVEILIARLDYLEKLLEYRAKKEYEQSI